ncbi:unnamed protein product [Brassicogethes aeneus]|uniref:DUF4806 domain-containing protein n=1 Tax=Brassicogethes aeneus TaxID=1431903 RepID=A0A9P0ARU7_BRAAE|nr:unnamed protein product [Brassicogethes aeneus]
MSQENKNYYLVEFPEEFQDGQIPMAIIPKTWLLGNSHCLWPNFKNEKDKIKAIINKNPPEKDSDRCKILIKYKTDSYNKAVEKLKKMEKVYVSQLSQSDSDNETLKRPKKPNKKYVHIDSDSDDALPSIPPVPSVVQSPIRQRILDDNFRLERLEAMLVKINLKQDKILEEIEDLKFKVCGNTVNTEMECYESFSLMTTHEELKNFNEKLGETVFFSNMCSKLRLIGGKDVVDSTRRILSKILSNSLAKQYNWKGKGAKSPFVTYNNIVNLIIGSLRLNNLTKDASTTEVESVIKGWLRTAGDREGGRRQRDSSLPQK